MIMAIQTLLPYDVNYRGLASDAGNSLAEGLQGLVKWKVDQMQKQKQADAFQKAGYSPEDIGVLQSIPQQDLFKFLSSYQPQNPQSNESSPMEQAMMQGFQGAQQPQISPTINLGALGGQGLPQDAIMKALEKTELRAPQQQNPNRIQQP